jgi:hypothetical protein
LEGILREEPESVDYLVLGDTTVLLEEPAGIRVVTDDRLEYVASVQHGAMPQHATGSADHDRSFAELVTEQRRHRNHPDGFWVASTDPAAAQHALTDTVARDGLHQAAVLSDGATRLVDRFGLLDWTDFLGILAEPGPEAIIAQVRAAEGSDPDGQRWPRGKRHDDASAAFFHLTYLRAGAWGGTAGDPRGGSLVLPPRPGWRDLAGRCWHAKRPQGQAVEPTSRPWTTLASVLGSGAGLVGRSACGWESGSRFRCSRLRMRHTPELLSCTSW